MNRNVSAGCGTACLLPLIMLTACGSASGGGHVAARPDREPTSRPSAHAQPVQPDASVDAGSPEPPASVTVADPPAPAPSAPTRPSITAAADGTDGSGQALWAFELSGFPAISRDERTVVIGDYEEYRDHFVSVWSIGRNRQQQRITLPAASPRAPDLVERVERVLEQGDYSSMRPLEVHPSTGAARCTAGEPCVLYESGGVTIRRATRAPLTTNLPRRRLLLGGEGVRPCAPGGSPEPPIRVWAWADAQGRFVLLKWIYQAFAHGCELPNQYRVYRL